MFSSLFELCCRKYFHIVKRRGSYGECIDFIAQDGWEKENSAAIVSLCFLLFLKKSSSKQKYKLHL